MLGDAALSQKFAARMLEKGVYVIGFFYPVVPHGTARVRTQVSAGHSREDLEFAVKAFLKKNNINPDKDVMLRSIGGTALRAAAIEKGIIAAAPFSTEDAVRLIRAGYSVISNMNESLGIPQNIIVTRSEVLEKYPETSKRILKAYIQGIQLAKFNKKEAIKAGYDSGTQGEPNIVSAAWDLYSPGLTADLSIAVPGIQQMLDEDIRAGFVDKGFTVDRVINDRILRIAQQELRAEGKLKQ